MSNRLLQIGLISAREKFTAFHKTLRGVIDELRDILAKESITPILLDIEFGFWNSRGLFMALTDGFSKDSNTIAVALSPRKLKQFEGAPSEVNYELPLILMKDTQTTDSVLKATFLHECGHAKRDYPTISEILAETDYGNQITGLEIEYCLRYDWNPFSNQNSWDPFREYVARETARKYFPIEVDERESKLSISLRDRLSQLSSVGFFLGLYAKVICDLDGLSLPKIRPDSTSASIADAIRRGDYYRYVMQVIGAMFTDDLSPFRELRAKRQQILEQAQQALKTKFAESIS